MRKYFFVPEIGCIPIEILLFVNGTIQFNDDLGLCYEKNFFIVMEKKFELEKISSLKFIFAFF